MKVNRDPPPLVPNPVLHFVFRYASSNGDTAVLTTASLMNLIWFASGTTAGGRLFSAFRLGRIEAWGVADSSVNFTSINLQWDDNYTAPQFAIQDNGNANRPAHIVAVPPARSLAGFWHSQTETKTNVLAYLSGPKGMIVDIHISYMMLNNLGNPYSLTTTGATDKALYYNYLDNTSSSGTAGLGTFSYISPQLLRLAYG